MRFCAFFFLFFIYDNRLFRFSKNVIGYELFKIGGRIVKCNRSMFTKEEKGTKNIYKYKEKNESDKHI